MEHTTLLSGGCEVKVYSLNTVIVGTGAAGYNAALRLYDEDVKDIAIITEDVNCGTSRNTGSDKQTYYKMNLCADYPDSPKAMAEDLFNGKCVDGDIAYCEAALSVKCFLHLAELGVPFPTNRYGEYVGYKTDHDPRARATSAGPLTSKLMTECLQKEADKRCIKVFDRMMVISIIKNNDTVCGLLVLNLDEYSDEKNRFVLFNCRNVIFATGGPAGMYADSVYPVGHCGSSGIMFEAGVKGKNLTEWQYGLASVAPRWNVSGTYMQVLPKFISVDSDGTEHEFLAEYYKDAGKYLSAVFRKGYEWPFDSRKAQSGSSIIDLLVYRERCEFGRRVYLDFRTNPCDFENLPFDSLDEDAYTYLKSAGACFGTPIERLLHMNSPAVELYCSKGVDIKKERLEIALCAQHNNGGVGTDMWWQTDIIGLFAAGEAVGSHGIYRPGGSALNAGQVGSTRAAQYISQHGKGNALSSDKFSEISKQTVSAFSKMYDSIRFGSGIGASALLKKISVQMSRVAGAIRDTNGMEELLEFDISLLNNFSESVKAETKGEIRNAFRLRDTLISQICFLSAMLDYFNAGGRSRGSSMFLDKNGEVPENLPEYSYIRDDGSFDKKIQETVFTKSGCICNFRSVRPIPEAGGFFENVWRQYRENKNIY